MNAKPGEFTLLSVATQFYAETSVVAQVPARCFQTAAEGVLNGIEIGSAPRTRGCGGG